MFSLEVHLFVSTMIFIFIHSLWTIEYLYTWFRAKRSKQFSRKSLNEAVCLYLGNPKVNIHPLSRLSLYVVIFIPLLNVSIFIVALECYHKTVNAVDEVVIIKKRKQR